MKTKFLLISLLCIGLLSCEEDNKRENDNSSSYIKNGALPGVFSVSDTKQVKFSQGNLQYQASTNTWRFAENQYDYVGNGNYYISSSYKGWIDLFGWGTGDNPTNVSEDEEDYSTFVDWGVNKISNGGNVANAWFTLSVDEWNYLLVDRDNAEEKQGLACVNGINGLVLLPDGWTLPSGAHFTSGYVNDLRYQGYQDVNTYTISEWEVMELAGAVFLPAAGFRDYTGNVWHFGHSGSYWSCSEYEYDTRYARDLYFYSYEFKTSSSSRCNGQSVRLCVEL